MKPLATFFTFILLLAFFGCSKGPESSATKNAETKFTSNALEVYQASLPIFEWVNSQGWDDKGKKGRRLVFVDDDLIASRLSEVKSSEKQLEPQDEASPYASITDDSTDFVEYIYSFLFSINLNGELEPFFGYAPSLEGAFLEALGMISSFFGMESTSESSENEANWRQKSESRIDDFKVETSNMLLSSDDFETEIVTHTSRNEYENTVTVEKGGKSLTYRYFGDDNHAEFSLSGELNFRNFLEEFIELEGGQKLLLFVYHNANEQNFEVAIALRQ